jgi:hypothetical protein
VVSSQNPRIFVHFREILRNPQKKAQESRQLRIITYGAVQFCVPPG